jgi:hypothetical protein
VTRKDFVFARMRVLVYWREIAHRNEGYALPHYFLAINASMRIISNPREDVTKPLFDTQLELDSELAVTVSRRQMQQLLALLDAFS